MRLSEFIAVGESCCARGQGSTSAVEKIVSQNPRTVPIRRRRTQADGAAMDLERGSEIYEVRGNSMPLRSELVEVTFEQFGGAGAVVLSFLVSRMMG